MKSEKYNPGTKIKYNSRPGEIVEYDDYTQQYTVQWYYNGKPFSLAFYDFDWLEKTVKVVN